jgi:hypothetical protein
MITMQLRLTRRIRMSGYVPPLPLFKFMLWPGTPLRLHLPILVADLHVTSNLFSAATRLTHL